MSDLYDVQIDEVIIGAVESGKSEVYTEMPGKITKYDPLTQTCSVKPQIKVPIFDPITKEQGESEELPELVNVPVGFFAASGFSIVFDLSPGDTVTIRWQYLATGQWRTSGELSEPQDVRRHNIGAAIVHPDARTMAKALLSPTLFKGFLALGVDGDPTGTIRIAKGSVICGGAAPQPLAMGPSVVAALTAMQLEIVALGATITAIVAPGAMFNGTALVDPTGAALAGTATTPAGSTTVIGAQATPVANAIAATPATITKGQ